MFNHLNRRKKSSAYKGKVKDRTAPPAGHGGRRRDGSAQPALGKVIRGPSPQLNAAEMNAKLKEKRGAKQKGCFLRRKEESLEVFQPKPSRNRMREFRENPNGASPQRAGAAGTRGAARCSSAGLAAPSSPPHSPRDGQTRSTSWKGPRGPGAAALSAQPAAEAPLGPMRTRRSPPSYCSERRPQRERAEGAANAEARLRGA